MNYIFNSLFSLLYNNVYAETVLLFVTCRGLCAGVAHHPASACLSGEN